MQPYYSSSLTVSVTENYGQLRVVSTTTRVPIPKVYVKVGSTPLPCIVRVTDSACPNPVHVCHHPAAPLGSLRYTLGGPPLTQDSSTRMATRM